MPGTSWLPHTVRCSSQTVSSPSWACCRCPARISRTALRRRAGHLCHNVEAGAEGCMDRKKLSFNEADGGWQSEYNTMSPEKAKGAGALTVSGGVGNDADAN